MCVYTGTHGYTVLPNRVTPTIADNSKEVNNFIITLYPIKIEQMEVFQVLHNADSQSNNT